MPPKTCALWLWLTLQLFASRQAAAEDVFQGNTAGFARSGLIVVPGTVARSRVMCVLDTGASMTVIDSTFRTKIKNPGGIDEVKTPAGRIQVERFESVDFGCVSFRPHTGPAMAADLSGFSEVAGIPVGAFLGMDYLQPLILQMRNGTPTFTDEKDSSVRPGEIAFDIRTIGGLPHVDVGLPILGKRAFLIDTGQADCCGMTSEILQRLTKANEAVVLEEVPIIDGSGVKFRRIFAVREMTVFGVTMRNVPVAELDVNLIGMGLMRHLDFSADFVKCRVYAVPSESPVEDFNVDASGLRTVFQPEDRVTIRRVVANSVAEEHQIQAGDDLLQIDSRVAADLSFWEIRELLSQSGKTISIKSQRGDEVRDIQLPLSRKFEYPPKWKPRSTQADDFQKFIESESIPAPK